MREQGLLDPARLFVDETAVSTSMARLRGRCESGERLIAHTPQSHWQTITFVAGLRHEGWATYFARRRRLRESAPDQFAVMPPSTLSTSPVIHLAPFEAMPVSVGPGATAFTRIPHFASSSATDLVMPSTACLAPT